MLPANFYFFCFLSNSELISKKIRLYCIIGSFSIHFNHNLFHKKWNFTLIFVILKIISVPNFNFHELMMETLTCIFFSDVVLRGNAKSFPAWSAQSNMSQNTCKCSKRRRKHNRRLPETRSWTSLSIASGRMSAVSSGTRCRKTSLC